MGQKLFTPQKLRIGLDAKLSSWNALELLSSCSAITERLVKKSQCAFWVSATNALTLLTKEEKSIGSLQAEQVEVASEAGADARTII